MSTSGQAHRRRASDLTTTEALDRLRRDRDAHPFWENRLLVACGAGALTREDFQFIFGQYYLYSRNFTRYLAGLLLNCEDDLLRSRLSQNLWEEGGGAEPNERHAQIFRDFLHRGLGLNLAEIEFLESTKLFVREYTDFCKNAPPAAASAFLALGTEAIIPRLYSILVEGLQRAGIAEEHLQFFHIHIACDDVHARTLEDIMCSYAAAPGWYETCREATDLALRLRGRFFERLYDMLQYSRIQKVVDAIQARKSLAVRGSGWEPFAYDPMRAGSPLHRDGADDLGVQLAVERAPFRCEVLDPRIVRIPPGKHDELHRHAHETVFYFIRGEGRVVFEDGAVEVKTGDVVFVPRWALHQSQNLSNEEMVVLAVTDYGLTGRAFIGDYGPARQKLR